MSWLTPWLAVWAAAAAVPLLVLLYFLKLKRREVEVGSTLLWKKAVHDLRANAPFQRLRKNLLLFVQLLILALALLAVAQPVSSGGGVSGERFVIVIDRSASMGAVDAGEVGGGVSRLERAKAEALRFVEGLDAVGGGARVMVVSFAGGAEVVQPFTSNAGLLRSAIERIGGGEGPSRIGGAVELVRPHVRPGASAGDEAVEAGAELRVYSDGRIVDVGDVRLHPDTRTRYVAMGGAGGGAVGNVGIVAMRAERPFDEPERADLFVGLANSGAEAVTVDVELRVDGKAVDVRGVTVPGADVDGVGGNGVVFSLDRDRAAVCEAVVLNDDVLEADNGARVVLPPGRRLRIGFVSAASDPFLDSLLESLDVASLTRLTPAAFEEMVGTEAFEGFDLFVMKGWTPSAAPVADEAGGADGEAGGDGGGAALSLTDEPGLPAGSYVFLDAVPALAGLQRLAGDAVRGGAVASARREHPVLRFTAIEELRVREQVSFAASGAAGVLAETGAGPLMAEVAHGEVTALVLGFDPADSTWFVDPNLVVLMASAVQHLTRGGDGSLEAGSLRTGEVLSASLPAGARDVELRGPGLGKGVGLELTPDGRVNWGPIERSGLYRLSWRGPAGSRDVVRDGRAVRLVPVNLLSEVESDVRVAESLSFASSEVGAVNRGDGAVSEDEPRRWWPWLLVGALGVLLLEWWIYNRRVYL